MIEHYYSGRLCNIYVCTDTGRKMTTYFDALDGKWNRFENVDNKVIQLTKIRWKTLKTTSSYSKVSGQENKQQQLFYIRDLGTTNIRVPFFYHGSNIIILFAFKKKTKKEESKFFGKAEWLQTKINKWINKNGFPNP